MALEFKVKPHTKFVLGHRLSMCLLSEGMTEFSYIAFSRGDEPINYVPSIKCIFSTL